jgi:tRNA pseudouridine32 synthase/23S rRNA pseudouridine746 synthase
LPIIVDWPNRPLRKIDFESGKPSSTRWRCVAYDADRHASRLELEPLTGRSHQLRVHLQAIGHPILGDALYAPPEIAAASARLLLHATELGFAHPINGAWISFTSPDGFQPSAGPPQTGLRPLGAATRT